MTFKQATALELPFADAEFDFVCCSGVLHHTRGVERGLREIHRVLKPGGSLYLLLYGAGGVFWPLNALLRPFAALVGQDDSGSSPSSMRVTRRTSAARFWMTFLFPSSRPIPRNASTSSWRMPVPAIAALDVRAARSRDRRQHHAGRTRVAPAHVGSRLSDFVRSR